MSEHDTSAPNAPNVPPVVHGAPELARVKPLVWERIAGARALHEFYECVSVHPRHYAVRTAGPDRVWQYWDVPSNCWLRCDDLSDGQRKSEAHYRAALFGPDGPLEPATDAATLIAQMHAEDGCDGETLAECIQQLRNQRLSAKYEMYGTQAHVARLRAALEPYHVAFPEAGVVDGANGIIWDEDADNLMEDEDLVRVGDMAAAALAATPEQSLAALRNEAAAEALARAAELAEQDGAPLLDTSWLLAEAQRLREAAR